MPVNGLRLKSLGPFDRITFGFDPHINLLVGANNTGKSTALMALGDILVHPFDLPTKLLRDVPGRFALWHGIEGSSKNFTGEFEAAESGLDGSFWRPERYARVGAILERVGYTAFIPALRSTSDFRSSGPAHDSKLTDEPTAQKLRELAERSLFITDSDSNSVRERILGELARREALLETDPFVVEDSSMIQALIELDYKGYRENKPALRQLIGMIATTASRITDGFPIEFSSFGTDEEGLFLSFRTPDGILPLNALSQGTQSIIQWLARLIIAYAKYYDYPDDLVKHPGIVIIDEIDAHLHPSWQRRILPTLTETFPNLQFFCSTHSPLMLAGLKAGQVHLLKRNEEGGVSVSRNETDIVGWTSDEILRSFLDIDNPTDLRTHENLQRLQALRRKSKLSAKEKNELEELRQSFHAELLGGPGSGQVDYVSERLDKAAEYSAKRKPKAASRPSSKGKAKKRKAAGSKRKKASG